MPTATHITYYHLCHRKLWLFTHGMSMESSSVLVEEGKWLHETAYGRRATEYTEVQIGNIKIDHYNTKTKFIHETKKSNKREAAHIAQLKYYIYKFEEANITVHGGILEYPKLREREEVFLTDKDRAEIPHWIAGTKAIMQMEECPPLEKKTLCKKCAYFDFCYVS
jgi:CRISPR-associated exonuclease Cas4